MTSTHTNIYSYGNNEKNKTKILYSIEPLKIKKVVDSLSRKKIIRHRRSYS